MIGRAKKHPWPRSRPALGAYWRDHGRIARDTGHFLSARLGTSLLVWLLVGIALALPAGLLLLRDNLTAMTGAWEGRPGLSAYFELGVDVQTVRAAAASLQGEPGVAEVSVITQEQALTEFQQYTGLSDALALLEENPLPASLRVSLAPDAQSQDLERLRAKLAAHAGVDEVVAEKTWLERVSDITEVVTRLGMMLGLLFGLGAVLVTATSVRLAIEARLDELRVLKLVGATDAQIRRPFLYFGAFFGLGGGLVAAMLISICLMVVERPLTDLIGSYGHDLGLAGFDLRFVAGLLGSGGVLGIAGALLAARQRLARLEIL